MTREQQIEEIRRVAGCWESLGLTNAQAATQRDRDEDGARAARWLPQREAVTR